MLLGQIAKALPQARILHIRRDAVDTCFSNLRTLFTREATYSYDQLDVADFYAEYAGLMAHWKTVLGERVYEVDYHQLVAEPRVTIRSICERCGITFDPAMLDVSRAGGSIATASSSQIRQGIVSDRGGAWRAFKTQLGSILERLAGYGLTPPQEAST